MLDIGDTGSQTNTHGIETVYNEYSGLSTTGDKDVAISSQDLYHQVT